MKKLYPKWFSILLYKKYCRFCAVGLLFFSVAGYGQSNHTVTFTNSPSDFNSLEKLSASGGNTDYYITFDQNNLYIGAFRTSGNFASGDNLAVYFDTDPHVPLTVGNGTQTGKTYNGVSATMPFGADYNVYVQQSVQEANYYNSGWVVTTGPSYSTSNNSREVKIPFSNFGNPYALNITLWIGTTGGFYSNAPGANKTSSSTPSFSSYFGTFGVRNGTQGNVNPVDVILSPATDYTSANSISGGTYAYVDVDATTTINGLTLAPGGVINVQSGKSLTSTGTINNTAIPNNTKSTQINVSGTYTLNGRAFCSDLNVNNGGTYIHNSPGSTANGVPSDWPGIDSRTYGNTSNVEIQQWATNSASNVSAIPAPTSGGWGNVTFDISQSYNCNWAMNGAFNEVAGNLVLNNLGTGNSSSHYVTFSPSTGSSVMNIGGNFEMDLPDKNSVYLSLANSSSYTQTMNVYGDFIVKGDGHLKLGYHNTKAIINYWGNYSQTGGEIKSETNSGIFDSLNAYGVNKTMLATGGSFNTNNIAWVIKDGAVIDLTSDLYFWGDDYKSSSNAKVEVYGRLNCNGYVITDEYIKTVWGIPVGSLHGNGVFTLANSATLGIGSGYGITESGSGLDIIFAIPPWRPTAKYGNVQFSDRTFSTKANYVYNGTSNQVTGDGLPATVNSLSIDNSGSSNKTVSLTNDVTVTSYHEISDGEFALGNKNVTLHSGADTTAAFHELNSAGSINYNGTGRYIVERYINTGTGTGQHGKSWQLLSTPADGETIRNTWQEGGSTSITGYGTWITDPSGTAGGFDASSTAPSMKKFVSASNSFVSISSTNNLIANPNGYFLFVRGDRQATLVSSPATPTTLRLKGKLFTGDQSVSVPANSYQTVGNPYASSVDFQKVYSQSFNIDNNFYVWDPSIAGSYGVGGYQTVSGTTGYIAIPGGSSIYSSGTDYRDIQSGQAIFVHNSTGSTGNVKFSEDSKETGSRLVTRGGGLTDKKQILYTNLYTSSGILADGNAVVFNNVYSDKIDINDAFKLSNGGENFGLRRYDDILSVEARSAVSITDTVFYNMNHLRRQSYRLLFVPVDMTQDKQAFLIDQYRKTEQEISLSDSTRITFDVNTDPASSEAGRLLLVFRQMGALSVSFLSLNAIPGDVAINVVWKTENENNIDKYEIESSVDGIHFATIGNTPAQNISKCTYNYIDTHPAIGNNYYRIRSIEKDGIVKYSSIVKVHLETINSSFCIYPNPVIDGKVNLHFVSQPAGNYHIRVINSAGATLLSKDVNFSGGSIIQQIPLDKTSAKGMYHLEIIKPDGKNEILNFLK